MKKKVFDKIKLAFQILFGVLFAVSLCIVILDLTVLNIYNYRLLPDISIAIAFFTFVFAFLFIAVLSISGKIKLLMVGCEFVLIIISVVISQDFIYRYVTYNDERVVEKCSTLLGCGECCTYYYPIEHDVLMRTEPVAMANYGIIMGNADMVFLNDPIEIIAAEDLP